MTIVVVDTNLMCRNPDFSVATWSEIIRGPHCAIILSPRRRRRVSVQVVIQHAEFLLSESNAKQVGPLVW